jgi:hypothetical protein
MKVIRGILREELIGLFHQGGVREFQETSLTPIPLIVWPKV